jgi:hypothetical protein
MVMKLYGMFPKVVLMVYAAMAVGGCGTDYRVNSVINPKKNHATMWQESVWRPRYLLDMRKFSSPTEKFLYINPYAYNPVTAYVTPDLIADLTNQLVNLNPASNSVTGSNLPPQIQFGQVKFFVNSSLYLKAIMPTSITHYTDSDRKYYRNELQNAILQAIDESTEQQLAELKATENNVNLLLGGATLGLAGGASVAAAQTAKALAAAAAGTAGARSLVNEQIYRNTFVESVISLVTKDQSDFLAIIRQRQTNSIYDYTVEGAIMDAREYEERGSFYNGLALLQQAVQNKINGGTNTVAINQYVRLPEIGSQPSPFPIALIAATSSTSASATNILVSGSGFSLLNVKQTSYSPSLPQWLTINIYATSDSQLTVSVLTTLTNNYQLTNVLEIPYTIENANHTLDLPLVITITKH